jgi:hypothetical protein
MKRSSPGADIDSVRLSAGDKINVRQFQRTIAMDPTFPLAHEYFFFLLKTMGRFEEGIKEYEKSEVLGGSSPEDAAGEAAMMRQALMKGGETGLWQKTLQLTLERQVVFTLPGRLPPLVLQNKTVLYDLLFRTSAETSLEVARNPKHLGAETGYITPDGQSPK